MVSISPTQYFVFLNYFFHLIGSILEYKTLPYFPIFHRNKILPSRFVDTLSFFLWLRASICEWWRLIGNIWFNLEYMSRFFLSHHLGYSLSRGNNEAFIESFKVSLTNSKNRFIRMDLCMSMVLDVICGFLYVWVWYLNTHK